MSEKPAVKYLKDYVAPAFLVQTIDLDIDIHDDYTQVIAELGCKANPETAADRSVFICNGTDLELVALYLNGEKIENDGYLLNEDTLTVLDVPDTFTLKTVVNIKPHENTSLEGLYVSNGIFCTQCESEGFRKITFFPDRPDVMAVYSTKITANKTRFPVLLSNGNCVEKGDLENGRHWVKWEDKFQKPSYLFAMVAGDLGVIDGTFKTMSGRDIELHIYSSHDNIHKCGHAMECLKQSMKWDEEVYGREYDLDMFMIVAVDDFNAGAMENKGLNIFNSALVLAKPETATDNRFKQIQGVIGHEYFHNWTGNRVTCRDWFQLSLKEGLTIFRDQHFTADMNSATVKRIEDVNFLRNIQFPEDASPLAHAVRPESYIQIDNFYTVTVYHKGAELIEMIHTIIGKDNFFKGMDLYFKRHDHQAVTIEDFVKAMEDASEIDLSQFRLWYSQAGTPELKVDTQFDRQAQTYAITFTQSCRPTPENQNKKPFHIPVKMGLIGIKGHALQLYSDGLVNGNTEFVYNLKKESETIVFSNIAEEPTPSVLRGFSAPVKLKLDLSDSNRIFLMANDKDGFNQWEASQQLMTKTALNLIEVSQNGGELSLSDEIKAAFGSVLLSQNPDKHFLSQVLTLPSEEYISEQMECVDVKAVYEVRKFLRKEIATALKSDFLATYKSLSEKTDYSFDAVSVGKRCLKNLSLSYLCALGTKEVIELAERQFNDANNMTDQLSAFTALVNTDYEGRQAVIEQFFKQWKNDSLVMDLWFATLASSHLTHVKDIQSLMSHPAFDSKNPNKVRSLIGTYCNRNHVNFHNESGDGYRFLADQIIRMDGINAHMASYLFTPFSFWKRYKPEYRELMKKEIKRITEAEDLSKNVFEVASKTLD